MSVFRTFAFLCGQKLMKRILLAVLACAVVSCGLEEVGRRPASGAGNVWLGPGANAGAGNQDRTVVYVTAMDYPEGYDWRADREKGAVKCSLVVYADGIPMMKIPVGDSYEVSSDPDMHRMVNGHLYSDYAADSETIIKKDGKEIMRYPAREMICALTEKDGDVYTLGHSRGGSGFSYRKNGEAIIERAEGHSFGRLSHYGDSLSFAFCEPVISQEKTIERYYHVVNGKITQTAVREDVKKVWDIISCDGEVTYLASVVGISTPVLFRSGEMKALNMPESSKMLTCRIVHEAGTLYVEGLYMREGKPLTSGLWNEDGQVHIFADGMTVSSICMDGDGLCCTLNGSSSPHNGIIYRFGETYPMPPGYTSLGTSPAVVVDGILHVALSSLTGAPPLIWKDGETGPLKINGFISSISTDKKN